MDNYDVRRVLTTKSVNLAPDSILAGLKLNSTLRIIGLFCKIIEQIAMHLDKKLDIILKYFIF